MKNIPRQPTAFASLYPRIGTLASTPTGVEPLDVEPLAQPTRGTKNTPSYNAHSYPTKVPAEAIEPYIEHHTRPGDLVLDPFCGSGMTGLAARRLGRDVVLNDLGFGAAHLAWNLCEPCDPDDLREAACQVLDAVREEYSVLYTTPGRGRQQGTIRWTLYSTVVACVACSARSRLWNDATDYDYGTLAKEWPCPNCSEPIQKRTARVVGSEPAWMLIEDEEGTFERAPCPVDLKRLRSIGRMEDDEWYPSVPLGRDREMFIRSALHLQGVANVADFWTPRNRRALARLWREIQDVADLRLRQALSFAFTNTAWHGTRMRRYNARGGQRPLTGTLYIPQLSIEVNPAYVFMNKIRQLARFYRRPLGSDSKLSVLRGSADALALPDQSIDYCFTDPPFGSNIFYADCATVWESWLGETTPVKQEAVVNRSLRPTYGGKTVDDYAALMEGAFCEVQRVLKPNAWATVVFQSSDAEVWAALRAVVEEAGFDLANASFLDKTQQSHKGYKGRSGREDVASFDVVLNLHKPGAKRRQPKPPGGFDDAAGVLRAHLASLSEIGSDDDADRQRTLPFLHSLLVQEHFNGTIGLEVGRYALVRRICEQHFRVDADGRWYQDRPSAATNRAKRPGIA
jgi:DNA modification methylase